MHIYWEKVHHDTQQCESGKPGLLAPLVASCVALDNFFNQPFLSPSSIKQGTISTVGIKGANVYKELKIMACIQWICCFYYHRYHHCRRCYHYCHHQDNGYLWEKRGRDEDKFIAFSLRKCGYMLAYIQPELNVSMWLRVHQHLSYNFLDFTVYFKSFIYEKAFWIKRNRVCAILSVCEKAL